MSEVSSPEAADRGNWQGPRLLGTLLAAFALAAVLVPAAGAQPFGAWMTLSGPLSGFVQVPSSPALNPSGAITIEGWVNVTIPAGQPCVSLFGKNWTQTWWVGVCTGNVLRSFVRGDDGSGVSGAHSFRDAGTVPPGEWTHVAAVFDGTQRRHYINGELAGSWAETGALTTNTDPVEIGSDVQNPHSPAGAIDEVRLWNVGRTQDQIRSTINLPVNTPQPGLVAVWPLDGNALDPVGGHDGSVAGSGVGAATFPVTLDCGSSTPSALCLKGRFSIITKFRQSTPPNPTDGAGHVVVAGANSGIFWFFSSDNWEVMVKAINGCALNSHYWIYSAATTDRFYRMEVLDVRAGVQKIYFNYAGPPAPAVTDSSAFATCP